MSDDELVQRYFDAWNAHDASAIVSTFSADGTYSDPTTKGELQGNAIGDNASQLWKAFPDVRFEIRNQLTSQDGRFAAQWVMTGTNQGSFAGLPPTGRTILLQGADFIEVRDGAIRSVEGYFDVGEVPRQLGLQIVVQPRALGPFTFGTSIRLGGSSPEQPGAFSVTSLRVRNPEDVERVRNYSQQIATELIEMKGFLGWVGVTVADRMLTVTAWRDPDDVRALTARGTHLEASRAFFGPDVAAGGWTGIWQQHRLNATWVRCTTCGTMSRLDKPEATCKCGANLGPAPAYW